MQEAKPSVSLRESENCEHAKDAERIVRETAFLNILQKLTEIGNTYVFQSFRINLTMEPDR